MTQQSGMYAPDDPEMGNIESTEALAWMQQGDGKWRHVGDSSERLTPEQTLRYIQELYEAGAVAVYAERIEFDSDIESGDSLKVMLPQDPQKRVALFSIEERILRETGSPFDAEGEQGQASFTLDW